MAFALPLAIAGGVAGGIFGAKGASSRNRAVRKSAEISMDRMNDYITQTRVDRLLKTEQLARQAQVEVGAVLNVAPESLSVMETIASRIVRGIASDQFSVDEEMRRQETAAEAEKQNIATEANNNMTSSGMAGFTGALSGFSQGMNFGGAIDGAIDAGKAAKMQGQMNVNEQQQSGYRTEAAKIGLDVEKARLRVIQGELNRQAGLNRGMMASPHLPLALRVLGPIIAGGRR